MSERMGGGIWIDTAKFFGFGENVLNTAFGILPAVHAFKKPINGTIDFEIVFYFIEDFVGEDGVAVFFAFPFSNKNALIVGLNVAYSQIIECID